MRLFRVVLVVLGLALIGCSIRLASGAGPWQAQVVDAETGAPLEGVVVLASWWKGTASVGGWVDTYHDSIEVATDREGRFTIPARKYVNPNPFTRFGDPLFVLFKPGYGRALWPPAEQPRLVWPEGMPGELVIRLPRLATLEERRKHVRGVRIEFLDVPPERTPLLVQAIRQERQAVGLPE
jgi:hypothetical protein